MICLVRYLVDFVLVNNFQYLTAIKLDVTKLNDENFVIQPCLIAVSIILVDAFIEYKIKMPPVGGILFDLFFMLFLSAYFVNYFTAYFTA